jgi:hypothetical protein
MKSLFSSFAKSPVTKLMGLFLFVLGSLGMYNGNLSVMWDGSAVLFFALTLTLMTDKQVKGWLSKVFNAVLDRFKKAAPFILMLVFASCGVIKNVDRSKDKAQVKTDSVSQVKGKAEIKTVTTEEVDTTATVKGSEIKGSTPLKDLATTPLILEDENQRITVSVDSLGKLHVAGKVRERSVGLKYHRKTESTVKTESTIKTETSKTTSSKTVTTDKDVRRYGFPWWLWLIVALSVLAGAAFYALRKGWFRV